MTKEEVAQKFADMLTEQQCRQLIKNVLLFALPGAFNALACLTSENKQTIRDQDQQQMQTFLQSIREYNKCRCAELRKEENNG